MELMMPPSMLVQCEGCFRRRRESSPCRLAVDATRPDALRHFALYYLKLVDTAKGAGMGEAAPIGFVLGVKPASST